MRADAVLELDLIWFATDPVTKRMAMFPINPGKIFNPRV